MLSFIFAFLASFSILGYWSGLMEFNFLLIFYVSFFASYLFCRKKIEVPLKVCFLALLVFILCAYPVLLITPFFPNGADSAVPTAMRVLEVNNKIPATYYPYSTAPFTYPLAFSILAEGFYQLFPIMPDYLWAWLLGCIFGALQLLAFFLFIRECFGEKVAVYAAVLFIGTKMVFMNVYTGQYGWEMATAFAFMFLYHFKRQEKMALLYFPLVLMAHPAIFLNLIVLMFFLPLKASFDYWLFTFESFALALPFLHVLRNFGNGLKSYALDFGALLTNLKALPLWIGLLVFLLAAGRMAQRKFSEDLGIVLLVLFSISIYSFSSLFGFELHAKLAELVMLGFIILAAKFAAEKNLNLFALLAISLLLFAASGDMNHYRNGSKITMDKALEAQALYASDGNLSCIEQSGKFAEYARKLPANLWEAGAISHTSYLTYKSLAGSLCEKS